MTAHPWYPWYVNDFARDTRDLDWDMNAAYRFLLDATWERDSCSLPNDLKLIRRLIPRMDLRTFKRLVPPILEKFFTLNEAGEHVNKRLLKEKQKADKRSLKARELSEKRWKIKAEIEAAQCEPQPQSQPQSQKKERKGRASALPQNWKPELGANEGREWEKFKSYHLSKGSLFSNWEQAWRTWKLKAFDYGILKEPQPSPAAILPIKGFHARDGTPEMAAWDEYWRATKGINAPRSKRLDGYIFDSRWPPGYTPSGEPLAETGG